MNDPRYKEAKQIFADTSLKPSISMLQRRMRIGYNYASRLVDGMISEGVLKRVGWELERVI